MKRPPWDWKVLCPPEAPPTDPGQPEVVVGLFSRCAPLPSLSTSPHPVSHHALFLHASLLLSAAAVSRAIRPCLSLGGTEPPGYLPSPPQPLPQATVHAVARMIFAEHKPHPFSPSCKSLCFDTALRAKCTRLTKASKALRIWLPY